MFLSKRVFEAKQEEMLVWGGWCRNCVHRRQYLWGNCSASEDRPECMLHLSSKSSSSTLVAVRIWVNWAPRASAGTPGLCLSGDEEPDNTVACKDAGRFGVSPRQVCILLCREASLYGGCEIFCVKQGQLEYKRELRSALPSTHRHGDALNPSSWEGRAVAFSVTPLESPLYWGVGSGF